MHAPARSSETDVTDCHEGFLEIGARKTWYRTTGEPSARPPLLMLHGGPGGATGNDQRFVARVARDRQVIAYDQLDTGRSSKLGEASHYTLEAHLEELVAVREALGLEHLHLWGGSWGGMLALAYALTQPTGVRSITLASAPFSCPRWVAAAERFRRELDPRTRKALERCERSLVRRGPPASKWRGPSSADLDKAARRAARVLAPASTPAAQAVARALTFVPPLRRAVYPVVGLEFVRRHVYRTDPVAEGALVALAGMNPAVYERMWGPSEHLATGPLQHFDLTERLPEIDVPVLVTSGGHECVTPDDVKVLVDRVRDVEWELFEDAAHCADYEEPDRYTDVLTRFLDRVDARR